MLSIDIIGILIPLSDIRTIKRKGERGIMIYLTSVLRLSIYIISGIGYTTCVRTEVVRIHVVSTYWLRSIV